MGMPRMVAVRSRTMADQCRRSIGDVASSVYAAAAQENRNSTIVWLASDAEYRTYIGVTASRAAKKMAVRGVWPARRATYQSSAMLESPAMRFRATTAAKPPCRSKVTTLFSHGRYVVGREKI